MTRVMSLKNAVKWCEDHAADVVFTSAGMVEVSCWSLKDQGACYAMKRTFARAVIACAKQLQKQKRRHADA